MDKRIFKAEYSAHRLDLFLRDSLESLSRSRIEKYIRGGHVLVNGIRCLKKNVPLEKDSIVELLIPELEDEYDLNSFPFNRLFEDEHILIINKPEGIAVHPASGINEPTISDYFRNNYPDLKSIGSPERPGIVHRLDKGTSGVMILAKSDTAFIRLQSLFKKREIKKKYCAILEGRLRFMNGTVEVPLRRNPRDRRKYSADQSGDSEGSREALTRYSLRFQFKNSSYVNISPQTGRTHQIRVHMAYLGNPVLGDELYGRKNTFQRLALHAYSIEFVHPADKSKTVYAHAEIPPSFINYFRSEILSARLNETG